MLRTSVRRLSLLLGLLFFFAPGAMAQTATVQQIAGFEPPFAIVTGAVAQLPDGRTYGFYSGGFNGGIYQVFPDGHGGYTTSLTLEFPDGAGGPPAPVFVNGITGSVVAVGPDGKIYFSGATLSRFDPDTLTVEILHAFPTSDPTSLALGNDGHTLFGSSQGGQVYSYDTTTGAYRDIASTDDGLIGVVQMKDGPLFALHYSPSSLIVTMQRLDPVTGTEVSGPITQTSASALPPVKGDDGEVYVFSNVFGDRSVQRVDVGCFCLQVLQTWLFPSPGVSAMTGPRNGTLYLNLDYQPYRMKLTTNPPTVERLAQTTVYNFQLLPDGTLAMFDEAQGYALNTATATPDGTATPVFAAVPASEGANGFPSEFTEGPDGMLYGVADGSTTLYGSIFRVDPVAKTHTLVAQLDYPVVSYYGNGTYQTKMVLAPDGRFYGTYQTADSTDSPIFRFDPATNTTEIVRHFPFDQNTALPGPDGSFVNRLTVGSDGWLYGNTAEGNDPDTFNGTIFKLDPVSGAFVVLLPSQPDFPDTLFYPTGPMAESAPGVWIGTYSNGLGGDICASLYRFDASSGAITALGDLHYSVEGCPGGNFVPLARSGDGSMFGTLMFSANDRGSFFKLNPDTGAVTTLHQFGLDSAIQEPQPDLQVGADGFLYATYTTPVAGSNTSTVGVVRLNPGTGEATDLAHLPPGGFLGATGFFIGHDGRMYGGTQYPWKAYAIGILDPLPVAPSSGPYGGTTSVTTTLKTLGIALAGRTIAFTLNGHAIGSATTNAQGVATLNGVSLNGIAVGSHAGAIGASFAGDAWFPATAGTGSLTVIDVPTPGLMVGDGFIREDDTTYAFAFIVREKPNGADRGALGLRITDNGHVDPKTRKRTKPRDDQFVARSYTDVVFSDDPSIRPGRRSRPQVDTVLFAGPGEWNGQSGYRFEAFAQDCGEPGRHRESLRVIVYDRTNHVVAQVDDVLSAGNIQSIRIRH